MNKIKIIQIIETCEELYWKGICHQAKIGLIGLGNNGSIYVLTEKYGKFYWEKLRIESEVKIIQIILSNQEHYGTIFAKTTDGLVGLGIDGCIYTLKEYLYPALILYRWEKFEIEYEEEFEGE
ncbi:MAG: hypothetical protein ACO25K_06395 [Candidatus Fonsibacter ubiquis]